MLHGVSPATIAISFGNGAASATVKFTGTPPTPLVLIRQTLSGEFQHVEKRGKKASFGVSFLQRNHAYTLDLNPLDEKGTYTLEGNILTLKEEGGEISYYKVEENKVRLLNDDKQEITVFLISKLDI